MRSAKHPEFERNGVLYKQCSACLLEKEATVENFPPRVTRYSRFESQCRACVRAQDTLRRNSNIEHERSVARKKYPANREKRLLYNYDVSAIAEKAMRRAQGDACAICGTSFASLPLSEQHVDHSHTTDVARGILCGPCNRMLGSARDSVDVLLRAAAYLNDFRGRLGYIGATMDLLHPGHIRFLQWAKSVCKVVVVALNTDEFVAQYKQRPAQTLEERTEMLEGCRYVDGVTVNVGGASSRETILKVRPSHILCGSDWSDRAVYLKQLGIDEQFISENGLSIVLCPLARHFSTTELKQRIKNG